jgi:hypothetical protein
MPGSTVPFLLIMGFTLHFFEMHFDKTHGYIIRMIASCSFPITKKLVNKDEIGEIINAVEKSKVNYQIVDKINNIKLNVLTLETSKSNQGKN